MPILFFEGYLKGEAEGRASPVAVSVNADGLFVDGSVPNTGVSAIEVDRAHMSRITHQLKSPIYWGLLNKSWAVQLHSLHSGCVCYAGVSEDTWSVDQMRTQRELKNPFMFS